MGKGIKSRTHGHIVQRNRILEPILYSWSRPAPPPLRHGAHAKIIIMFNVQVNNSNSVGAQTRGATIENNKQYSILKNLFYGK